MKFYYVDYLLDVKYNGKMRFRFSINVDYVIKNFELGILFFDKWIEVVVKVVKVGYLLGFIVVLIYIYEDWEEGYRYLFEKFDVVLLQDVRYDIIFELIQYCFIKLVK